MKSSVALLAIVALLCYQQVSAWTLVPSLSSRIYSRTKVSILSTTELEGSPLAPLINSLQDDLTAQGLGLCHGVLHASGVRHLSDLQHLTEQQIDEMGIDTFDRRDILRVQESFAKTPLTLTEANTPPKLSTCVDGGFHKPSRQRFELDTTPHHDFCLEPISPGIFKGRLFTTEQCDQLNRMAEYHAYRGIGTIDAGWTNQLYTLTAQHIQCKEIPGMISITRPRFQQLFNELYDLFPGRLIQNSICFESDGEPHLVKYNGKAKGTRLHTDNSEFIYITVNAALSAQDEYTGGGTYFTDLDATVPLQQGEMLVHLGDVEHSGAEITSGVRRIFIAFLACEWQDAALNLPNLENARDYYDDENENGVGKDAIVGT